MKTVRRVIIQNREGRKCEDDGEKRDEEERESKMEAMDSRSGRNWK